MQKKEREIERSSAKLLSSLANVTTVNQGVTVQSVLKAEFSIFGKTGEKFGSNVGKKLPVLAAYV